MPNISRFYGLTIKMFFLKAEHNPPHIHAVYGEYQGAFDFVNLKMLYGDLPRKAANMVAEWAEKYQKELIEMWETQRLDTLPPLE